MILPHKLEPLKGNSARRPKTMVTRVPSGLNLTMLLAPSSLTEMLSWASTRMP